MTNSADLDLHCSQKQGISGFSRTRVKEVILHIYQLVFFFLILGMFDLAFSLKTFNRILTRLGISTSYK